MSSFPCWCDGDVECEGRAEVEYGLCHECQQFGHRAFPPLPFSFAEGGVVRPPSFSFAVGGVVRPPTPNAAMASSPPVPGEDAIGTVGTGTEAHGTDPAVHHQSNQGREP